MLIEIVGIIAIILIVKSVIEKNKKDDGTKE